MRSISKLASLLAIVVCCAPAAAYDYNYGSTKDDGFFVFLDGVLATPGGLDQVVGTNVAANSAPQTSRDVKADWGAGTALRGGAGYQWATGGKVEVSFWMFDDDETIGADGPTDGFMNFAIGPAVYYQGYPSLNFGVPGRADFTTEVEASLIDVTFAHEQDLNDVFSMEWNVGVRFATFEENYSGSYDLCASTGCSAGYGLVPGDLSFDAAKSNESDMAGLRAGVRGRYRVSERFAITSGLSFSLLNGEVESRSTLIPTGIGNSIDPPSIGFEEDTDRTGEIRELDLAAEIHIVPDRVRLSIGYEHSVWDEVGSDLLRNPPGLLAVLRPRDRISFSGVRLGVWARF